MSTTTTHAITLWDDPAPEPSPAPGEGIFADLVFDRPMDSAYTYAVPESLVGVVGVGKRVEAPLGRGDRPTVGYCVRVGNVPPSRPAKAISRVLDDEPLLTDGLLRLTRWMADYYLCGWGQVVHSVVPAGVRQRSGLKEALWLEAIPVEQLKPPLLALSPKQKQALEVLRGAGEPLDINDLGKRAACGRGPLLALVDKGFARQVVRVLDRAIDDGSMPEVTGPLTLNAEQAAVLTPVTAAVETGGFHSFLLHGVTGSGKTEVYLRAIEACIAKGKEAIVLVPEISLTPQTIERFRGRCGTVAVLHSHLGDADRGAHWRSVAAGKVQVVVGARSAVFAPTKNLGLIVIDEEHETSFKQEATPRYHARDVAVMRARLENVPILMGSATPSLESWHNAKRGTYTLLTLPQRVLSRPLPKVQLVDMRHEKKTPGKFYAVGPTLEQAMKEALKAGGQAMLLLNRRGFSTHVHCTECGYVATCQNCDLSMTFHKARNVMVCHYCGHTQLPLDHCPQCRTAKLRYQGLGTEKLQAEVEEKFPGRVVQRMDSDTTQRPGSHRRILDAFRNGLIHILLGTQMIAKGLDFPNVTLVGVVNADVGLHLPDFRSAERTFQLLAQVAGRTGRGPLGGKVLVQTFTPEHPCVEQAAKHDYVGFATRELTARESFGYPPYQRLARLIVRSEDIDAASKYVQSLAGAFQQAVKPGRLAPDGSPAVVRVLGPAEAPVFRLNNFFRFHFQLQSVSPAVLHRVLREVLAVAKPPAGVEFQVDIDPLSMM